MYGAAINVIREAAQEYAGQALQAGINAAADWALSDVNQYGTTTRPPTQWERNPWRSGAWESLGRTPRVDSGAPALPSSGDPFYRHSDNYDPDLVDRGRAIFNRAFGVRSKQHGPTPTEPFTGNPGYWSGSYGRKRRRASTGKLGSLRRKASSRGRKLRRLGGRKRIVRRRTTGKRSFRRTAKRVGYYRGQKSSFSRRFARRAKAVRSSTWLPSRLPEPSRSRSSTFIPTDRYRLITYGGTTQNTQFYKSPLVVLGATLSAGTVNALASAAAAEFLTRYAAGSNANAKYPSGISVINKLKLSFIPTMQLPGYVRVYAVTPKEWPDNSDRTFATDYTAAVASAGVPQNVQANNFPYVSATSNYYVQPHVNIRELSYLWKNWRFKKVKTIKVGPGIPVKPIVFTSRLTHYSFSDLNYAGYGTAATNPKNSVLIVVETVGANVMTDSSTATDASIMYGPGVFKCIYKKENEAVYRPFWEHAPGISTSPTVLSITKHSTGLQEITPYPMQFFGAPATATLHPTSAGGVVGTGAYYTVGSQADGSAFFNQPIRIPDTTANQTATGGQDESFYDRGQGTTANALKTAAA